MIGVQHLHVNLCEYGKPGQTASSVLSALSKQDAVDGGLPAT